MEPRGGGAKSGGAHPKSRILCTKTAFLGPKRPRNPLKTDKQRGTVATLNVRLDFPVTKSTFLPSHPTICPRNGPKMAKNGPNYAQCVSNTSKNKNGPYLGLRGSKPNSEGTYSPHPHTFCGFQASGSPN